MCLISVVTFSHQQNKHKDWQVEDCFHLSKVFVLPFNMHGEFAVHGS